MNPQIAPPTDGTAQQTGFCSHQAENSEPMEDSANQPPVVARSVSENSNPAILLHGNDEDRGIRQLNSLLRGEISAVETYRMAIEKLSVENHSTILDTSILRQIQLEHGRTAKALRDRISELGGAAIDSSGIWGTWAKLVMEAANIFGPATALKMLKQGEEHGMKDFRDAIEEVDGTTAHLIQNQFIPAQHRHIEVLDALSHSTESA